MKRAFLAALLLLAGAAAVRVGTAGRRDEATERTAPVQPAASFPKPEVPAPEPAREGEPLELLRGNAAWDRIAGMERLILRYRKSLGNPSDEWIRLVNLIRISAVELWEAPHAVLSDAELAFRPGGFENVRAAAQSLARIDWNYYEAARTRNAGSVAALRPSFEREWESFRSLARRELRR